MVERVGAELMQPLPMLCGMVVMNDMGCDAGKRIVQNTQAQVRRRLSFSLLLFLPMLVCREL